MRPTAERSDSRAGGSIVAVNEREATRSTSSRRSTSCACRKIRASTSPKSALATSGSASSSSCHSASLPISSESRATHGSSSSRAFQIARLSRRAGAPARSRRARPVGRTSGRPGRRRPRRRICPEAESARRTRSAPPNTGNVRSKLGEHLVQGLDGDHLVTERGQHPRQLARPGAEIDHPQRRIAGEPPRRLRRIARARALVDLGDRTERARPNRRVVAQTRPRSERIASTYVRVSAYRPCSRTAFAPW